MSGYTDHKTISHIADVTTRKARNRESQRQHRNSIKQRLNEVEALRTRNTELEERLRRVDYYDSNVLTTSSPTLLQTVPLPNARITVTAPGQSEYRQSPSFIQESATADLMFDAPQTLHDAKGSNNSLVNGSKDCGCDNGLDLAGLDCFGELLGIPSGDNMASFRSCDKSIQAEMAQMGAMTESPYSTHAVNHAQAKTNAAVYAAEHGMLDILGFLLDKGVTMGTKSGAYSTPLHQACERGDFNMVETILTKNGAQHINELDCAQLTPLHYAVKSGSLRVVELLVQQGAHVNLTFPRKERLAEHSPGSL